MTRITSLSSGNTTNLMTVSATPNTLITNQNTSVTFQATVDTSLADTYTLTAEAPLRWTVTIDSSGNMTVTPAPGVQGGTYPIQIIAQSQSDPNLIAQYTVDVTVTPTQPGMTLAVNPDPQITVPFNGAEVPDGLSGGDSQQRAGGRHVQLHVLQSADWIHVPHQRYERHGPGRSDRHRGHLFAALGDATRAGHGRVVLGRGHQRHHRLDHSDGDGQLRYADRRRRDSHG